MIMRPNGRRHGDVERRSLSWRSAQSKDRPCVPYNRGSTRRNSILRLKTVIAMRLMKIAAGGQRILECRRMVLEI
jgi:hypothetical protein